jgi:hypothetical protein
MADETATPAPTFAQGAKIAARYAKEAAAAATVEAQLAADIAPLKAAAEKKLAPIAARLATAAADAKAWWAVHGEQARGKKKSAEIAGCVLGTRLSPAKVVFAGGDETAAKAVLLKRRLLSLVVRVVSIDKKAIAKRLKDEADKPEAERELAQLGFTAEQDETFFIESATRTGRKS